MTKLENFSYFSKRHFIKKSNSFSDYFTTVQTLNREIYLNVITPQIAEEINKTIRFWNFIDVENGTEMTKRPPIKIFIDSMGGDFNAMLSIIDSIKLSLTPVYTINIGTTYKEAFYIYLAGHKRYSYPNATFVYKRDLQQLDEIDKQANLYSSYYERQLSNLKDFILEKTKITENEYNKHLKSPWWISAEDAKNLRICNTIIANHKIF